MSSKVCKSYGATVLNSFVVCVTKRAFPHFKDNYCTKMEMVVFFFNVCSVISAQEDQAVSQ